MYQIKKLRVDCTIDFAAEELKKYLRMMMPKCGEIKISYEPDTKDGFRLGLFEDFGIPFEGQDPALDDIVHVETDAQGGIVAGSNPRSVLYAVYRLLKENGCRFLFPGIDGEYIPAKQVEAVSYHKMASHRFRGHTTEGDPSIEDVLRYIDYHAKQEMNVYAVYEIYPYHRRYYRHRFNETNRTPEPVDIETVDQWQALCEAELIKRGMQIWGGGHGWVEQVVGIAPEDADAYGNGTKELPDEIREKLAMVKGVRGIHNKHPGYTNFCMSRPELRSKYADLVVAAAQKNPQLSQIATYLADNLNNHCECEECRKLLPSDYYVMIMNEIDEKLTAKGLPTKIQMVAYFDLMFAPSVKRLNNPDRFVLQATPISRKYTYSLSKDTPLPEVPEYERNNWTNIKSVEEYFAYLNKWRAVFPGNCTCYEYHYWVAQYRDPGSMAFSRRVYEDVRSWQELGMNGGLEDGSNKSFWPNGFVDQIYCATLWDKELDYDAAQQDYFEHCYGPDWKIARDYLQNITEAFNYPYMAGTKSTDLSKGEHYNPAHAESLAKVKGLAEEMRKVVESHLQMPTRPQNVSWRLLRRHTEWVTRLAEIFIVGCQGGRDQAKEMYEQFKLDFGKYDYELERYLDFGLAISSLTYIVNNRPKIEF